MKDLNPKGFVSGNQYPLFFGAAALGLAMGFFLFAGRKKSAAGKAASDSSNVFSLNGASEEEARKAVRGVGVATWM